MQRRPRVLVNAVHIGMVLDEKLDDLERVVENGLVQRGETRHVHLVDVNAEAGFNNKFKFAIVKNALHNLLQVN